jgi:hypothetical protein
MEGETGRVCSTNETMGTRTILVGKPEGKGYHENLSVGGLIL